MKVDGSIPSLIQGVSQQPYKTRLPGQCTLQENCSSNPVDGLTRRPPMQFISDLLEIGDEEAQFYDLRMGADLKFIVVALEGSLRVFSLDGEEQVVNEIDDAFDYLDGSPLCFATLENQTFIANRETIVEMDTNPANFTSFVTTGSLVYLLGGQYGRTYTITTTWWNGSSNVTATVSHTTPNGSDVSHGAQIATSYIAAQLQSLLAADTENSFSSTFTTSVVGDVIYIRKNTPAEFSCAVTDGDGGSHIKVTNGQVGNTGLLPKYAPHGYHVAITGDGGAGEDDWYVQFQCNPINGVSPSVGSGFGQDGLWVETHQKNIPSELIPETMPHILEYDEDTQEFDFKVGDWKGRQVGDENSNEDPTFVGRPVEDLAYFQGRLVILSGPAVIMSRTNNPLDFWIESATGPTDSDAIDVESTAQGVSRMLKAIPHNRDLVIFSDAGQFIVFGRNALTWQNASLVLTTKFEANMNAQPVSAGRNIFFAINYGKYGGVREFFTEGAEDVNDSRPITQHVLKYIEGSIRRMSATSNFDTLLVQATDPYKLYVYEYIWVDNTKAQSSWSSWIFPNQVFYTFFDESVIYVVSKVNNFLTLEKIDLDVTNDEGLNYNVFLDRKVYATGVNDEIVNLMPNLPPLDQLILIQGEGCPHPGQRVLIDSFDVAIGSNIISNPQNQSHADWVKLGTTITSDVDGTSDKLVETNASTYHGMYQIIPTSRSDVEITIHARVKSAGDNRNLRIRLQQGNNTNNNVSVTIDPDTGEHSAPSQNGTAVIKDVSIVEEADDYYTLRFTAQINPADTNPITLFTDLLLKGNVNANYPGNGTAGVIIGDILAGDPVATILLKENMEGGTVIAGQKFRSRFKPTMPSIKDGDGTAIGTGKLIISKFLVNTEATGVVESVVTSPYREPQYIRFIGRELGSPDNIVGQEAITSTALVVPFRDTPDNGEVELYTDSHLPMTLKDIEWKGQWHKRGNRVTQGA